ncbi:MAG: hypothetical protein IPI67_29995 [Myxococcales bacterium]|nr:hypothetical protein [Myxococcales bacterium]
MLRTLNARVGLAVSALALLRCGSCTSESDGTLGRTGGGGSGAALGGGGNPDAPSGAGGTVADAAADGPGAGGTVSDAGLSPEQTWLADPEAWMPVPGSEFTQPACSVLEAKEGKIGFPKLIWKSCGAGCEAAELAEGFGSKGALPTATTYQLAGGDAAFLTYDVWVNTAETSHYVRRVVRLEDGTTVGALVGRQKSAAPVAGCVFGNGRESARANALMGGDPGSQMYALAPLTGGQWVWSQPPTPQSGAPPALVEFDIDASGGAIFYTGKGGVWALLDPKANVWKPLEVPSASSVGAGQGDLAVWTDYPAGKPERIRGWATDGKGVRTLLDPAPKGTCRLNVSPTAIVGIALDGNTGCDNLPPAPKARFWWSPRKYDASGSPVTLGPDLPGSAFVPVPIVSVRAWGDYAGVVLNVVNDAGALDGGAYFLLANLATGKIWRLDGTTGHELHEDAWTLTPTHFYFADRVAGDGPLIVRRMFRYELAKLDQLASPQN